MAPTGSTLLGFFEAPFKGEFGREKSGREIPAENISAPMGATYAGAKKIKKAEGQTG